MFYYTVLHMAIRLSQISLKGFMASEDLIKSVLFNLVMNQLLSCPQNHPFI